MIKSLYRKARTAIPMFSKSGRFLRRIPGLVLGSSIACSSNGGAVRAEPQRATGGNSRIEVYSPQTYQAMNPLAFDISNPRAIDTGIYGKEIFVSDITSNTVSRYDERGRLLRRWGSSGRATGQFNNP
jgi:hypothetical protein